jgi:hypothetical protein
MSTATSKQHLGIIVSLLVLIGLLANEVIPRIRDNLEGRDQLGRMAQAEKFIPTLEGKFHADSRFQNITFSPYSGNGGSLMVRGQIRSDEDFAVLKLLIQDSSPPVPVVYLLEKP